MMNDEWAFGLLLTIGYVVCVETILAIHVDSSGGIWIDVKLLARGNLLIKGEYPKLTKKDLVYSPTDRREATINASQIVMALDLVDHG